MKYTILVDKENTPFYSVGVFDDLENAQKKLSEIKNHLNDDDLDFVDDNIILFKNDDIIQIIKIKENYIF